MKTFKRVASLALAFALVLTAFATVSFAANTFDDVPSDYQYAKAISNLVDEGILEGYENEDGTYSFKPENTVTRAEFAAIISRASIETVPELTTAAAQFSDMGTAEISWAVPYVSYAVSRGVINGFPADETGAVTFKPNDPVTYGQAVKMIVSMLGYGSAVEATDPWYQGYVDLAMRLGVTNGAYANGDDPAPRGMVAQLIDNMMNTNPQIQTGVDQNGNPIYSTSDNSFREETLQSESYTGVLMGVFNNTLSTNGYGLSKTEMLVGDEVIGLGNLTAESLDRYLGYEVKVTYTEDSSTGDWIAKSVSATNRNETYSVEDSDIDYVETDYLEYWADEDDNKVTKLRYNADNLYVIQNGAPAGTLTPSQLRTLLQIDTGNIEFIDNNGDGEMDVAFVTSYTTYVVGSRSENDGEYSFFDKFLPSGGKALVLDEDNDSMVVKRVNSSFNGFTDASVSSIAVGDVISVAESMSTDDIEVIISKEKKTGRVEELDTTSGEVTIGNNQYKYSQYYWDVLEDNADQEMSTNDNVSVYLDFMGKVAYIDRTAGSEKYAYIIDAARDNGMDEPVQLKIWDTSNNLRTVSLTYNARINGQSTEPEEAMDLIAEAAALVGSNAPADDEIWGSGETGANAEYAVLMRYEQNSSGDINSLYLVDGEMGDAKGIGYKYLASSKAPTKLTYSTSGMAFKEDGKTRFTINNNTKVFFVPYDRSDEDNYVCRTGTSYFNNNGEYYVDAYESENNTAPAKYVVVYETDASMQIAATARPVIVTGWSEKGSSDDKYYELRYYEVGTAEGSGDQQTIATEDDTVVEDVNLQVGDVIRFVTSGDRVEKIEVLFSGGELQKLGGSDTGFAPDSGDISEVWQTYNNYDKYFRALYGQVGVSPVESAGAGSMQILCADGSEETYTIDNASTVYVLDQNAADEDDIVTFSGTGALEDVNMVGEEDASWVLVISMRDDEHSIIVIE